MESFPETNWFAIIIAALIPMIVGFVFYHPKVFGTVWMNSLGLTEADLRKGNMGLIYGICLVMSFLLSFYMLNNVDGPGQEGRFDSFGHGALHGVLLTLFLVMPVMVTNGLFERKSFKNLGINLLYWMITLALMGGIIDAMNHWPADMPPVQ